jgi:hypothetical protein
VLIAMAETHRFEGLPYKWTPMIAFVFGGWPPPLSRGRCSTCPGAVDKTGVAGV